MRNGIAAVILGAGVLLGQQTWVVDTEGNGDFTTLGAAVQAASAGDTVVLTYWSGLPNAWSLTLSKGLTIVAAGPGRSEVLGHLVVADLPANERVVLRSLQLSVLAPYPVRVTVQDCAGLVVLDDVVLDGGYGQMFAEAALTVVGSHRVHVGRSQLSGDAGLVATDATVTCTDSWIAGANVVSGPGTAGAAVAATASRLWFAGTMLAGGSNYNGGGFAGPGRSGLVLAASTAVLAGAQALGGTGVAGYAAGVTLDATSSLTRDAAVWLGPVDAIAGPGAVATLETGSLSGGIDHGWIRLTAAPGAIGFVLLSLPGPEVATPFGPCWLGWLPAPLALGFVPLVRPLPSLSFLPRGFALTVQGAVLHGGALRLSAPLVTTAP
ncbi:MAG: hypothetical protein JNM25_07590 [Planctomycetes bacterium]|nr:hypothetical protein [Planctomycetota bacterium]